MSRGDVVNSFLPSFTFDFDPIESRLLEDSKTSHRYLWLVYRQFNNERIEDFFPEESICSLNALLGRSQLLDDILVLNGLTELVAGNFHRNRYSGAVTKRFICMASRCAGIPFPLPLPGVNDLPECQPGGAPEKPPPPPPPVETNVVEGEGDAILREVRFCKALIVSTYSTI